jgi:hypothetical protein
MLSGATRSGDVLQCGGNAWLEQLYFATIAPGWQDLRRPINDLLD